MNDSTTRPAAPRRKWKLIVGAALGVTLLSVLASIGGAAGLAWTNTEQFCIGCHEMRDNVYAEFKGTIHDSNRTGVRAVCSDCHVPREPGPMIVRKMRATFELWGHLTGVIDTKEKFESHRAMLAQRVWRRMKETDSQECRNCHIAEKMKVELQSEKARARHAKGKAEGMTCIDCHYGIAHTEPEGPGPQEMKLSGAGGTTKASNDASAAAATANTVAATANTAAATATTKTNK